VQLLDGEGNGRKEEMRGRVRRGNEEKGRGSLTLASHSVGKKEKRNKLCHTTLPNLSKPSTLTEILE
jgi:hypothetical protein